MGHDKGKCLIVCILLIGRLIDSYAALGIWLLSYYHDPSPSSTVELTGNRWVEDGRMGMDTTWCNLGLSLVYVMWTLTVDMGQQ